MTATITIGYPQSAVWPRRAAIATPTTGRAAAGSTRAGTTVTVAASSPAHANVGREDLPHPGQLNREDPG